MLPPTPNLRMTASEYFAMPEGPPYFQLVRGELLLSPSPVLRHQMVLLKILRIIANFLEDNPLGEVLIAPSDVQLGNGDVYQPDLYYVSRARLGILDQQGAKGAPDLVVEILSPSTAKLDRQTKREGYERAEVREIWFVDLWYDHIEVHLFPTESGAASVLTLEREEVLTTSLLPGLAILVGDALI